MDINAIRLCFQVFIPDSSGTLGTQFEPVVSEPIYDQKLMIENSTIKLSSNSSSFKGGETIFLLTEKVDNDMEVIFFEEKTKWEEEGILEEVIKHSAIIFKTPEYFKDIDEPVQVSQSTNNGILYFL